MTTNDIEIDEARRAALEVLRHNLHGAYGGLPRTAGWGYPEPYTRDLMLSAFGVLTTGDTELIDGLRRTLEALARNQSRLGQIPSLAHDPEDRGASDTTPLFLLALALYRETAGQPAFLDAAAQRALLWLEYQSPDDTVLVAQQPTSDWRDEQWVLGYGLYVNSLLYIGLRQYGLHDRADTLRSLVHRPDVRLGDGEHGHQHEGLLVPGRPYYALWSWKVLNDERCDLLGNSLAILAGIADRQRAGEIVDWIERQCADLRSAGQLALDLPPCLLPYMQPGEPDWRPRYDQFNLPGRYHNGGIWPFICGFYVAALVAAGQQDLARRKLKALAGLVRPARRPGLAFGFNEWASAQDGAVAGQDWQTWSAALYLYAVACVERGSTPFLDRIRTP
jgi:hypothetical protein